MSAKLLYSLSDENPNLQKQIGCMNGFLQFFERRHLINNRSNQNRKLLQGDNSQKGREANGTSKRSKEKQQKATTEMQGNLTEPSRVSVSSSTGSTLSIVEYDRTPKPVKPLFDENVMEETHFQNSRANRAISPPNTSHRFHMKNVVVDSISTSGSPIGTPKREHVARKATNHVDSPRILHPSRLDSPRLSALNESFRSVCSNHSAPMSTPLRRRDSPRMSYDGTEAREASVSGLKVGELPRLSLDSRQRGINRTGRVMNLPEEPASCRTPSNIVAKLMGLEAASDCSSINQSQINGRMDSLSRSSRAIDESKLSRGVDYQRSKYKDTRSPQWSNTSGTSTKTSMEQGSRKQEDGDQEVTSESQNHSVTVYGEIEKRLADIDFKKSGKDLRALKQILEAMHREKFVLLERRRENQSSDSASQDSSGSVTYTKQRQGPEREKLPEDMKSLRSVKQDKLVKSSRNETGHRRVRNVQKSFGFGVGQPVKNIHSVNKKTAKDSTPRTNRAQSPAAMSHKPLKTSKLPQHVTEVKVTSLTKTLESLSNKAMPSPTKHNQITIRSGSQIKKVSQNLINKFSTESTCHTQENGGSWIPESNNFSLIDTAIMSNGQSSPKYDMQQQLSDNNHPAGVSTDGSFPELAISIREQPSPVSVLDSAFYEDESPSPVKKKPTAFQGFYADDESTEATTEADWKDTDISHLTDSMKTRLNRDNTYNEQQYSKHSAQATSQLNTNKAGSITTPLQKEANVEKAYVAEILLASGFLDNRDLHANKLKEAINPNLFFILERTSPSRFLPHSKPNSKANTTDDQHQRKLMFDAVNEIVSQKLAFPGLGYQTQTCFRRSIRARNGQQLLQEICKEINQLQLNSLYQSLDDEDDFLTAIIEKDLTHRSGNWTDINSEIPGLVLDIERLIFKDLIVELIHDEALHAQAQNHQLTTQQ